MRRGDAPRAFGGVKPGEKNPVRVRLREGFLLQVV